MKEVILERICRTAEVWKKEDISFKQIMDESGWYSLRPSMLDLEMWLRKHPEVLDTLRGFPRAPHTSGLWRMSFSEASNEWRIAGKDELHTVKDKFEAHAFFIHKFFESFSDPRYFSSTYNICHLARDHFENNRTIENLIRKATFSRRERLRKAVEWKIFPREILFSLINSIAHSLRDFRSSRLLIPFGEINDLLRNLYDYGLVETFAKDSVTTREWIFIPYDEEFVETRDKNLKRAFEQFWKVPQKDRYRTTITCLMDPEIKEIFEAKVISLTNELITLSRKLEEKEQKNKSYSKESVPYTVGVFASQRKFGVK